MLFFHYAFALFIFVVVWWWDSRNEEGDWDPEVRSMGLKPISINYPTRTVPSGPVRQQPFSSMK
jgi:hypothetical protein